MLKVKRINKYKIKREPSLDEILRFVKNPATKLFIELKPRNPQVSAETHHTHMAGILYSAIKRGKGWIYLIDLYSLVSLLTKGYILLPYNYNNSLYRRVTLVLGLMKRKGWVESETETAFENEGKAVMYNYYWLVFKKLTEPYRNPSAAFEEWYTKLGYSNMDEILNDPTFKGFFNEEEIKIFEQISKNLRIPPLYLLKRSEEFSEYITNKRIPLFEREWIVREEELKLFEDVIQIAREIGVDVYLPPEIKLKVLHPEGFIGKNLSLAQTFLIFLDPYGKRYYTVSELAQKLKIKSSSVATILSTIKAYDLLIKEGRYYRANIYKLLPYIPLIYSRLQKQFNRYDEYIQKRWLTEGSKPIPISSEVAKICVRLGLLSEEKENLYKSYDLLK